MQVSRRQCTRSRMGPDCTEEKKVSHASAGPASDGHGDDAPIVLGKEASRVLAVNHVFELMVRAQSSDWAAAAECLPGRKKKPEE